MHVPRYPVGTILDVWWSDRGVPPSIERHSARGHLLGSVPGAYCTRTRPRTNTFLESLVYYCSASHRAPVLSCHNTVQSSRAWSSVKSFLEGCEPDYHQYTYTRGKHTWVESLDTRESAPSSAAPSLGSGTVIPPLDSVLRPPISPACHPS